MTLEEAFEKVGMPQYYQPILRDAYNQEHRRYHTLDHIQEMLKYVPKWHPELEIILDAILFHDMVHQPIPTPIGFNEALSVGEYVLYNTKLLAFNNPLGKEGDGSLEYECRVIEAINATSRHIEDQNLLHETSKFVLDLDLSTFALPWDEYEIWSNKVREENRIIWKDKTENELEHGRIAFLKTLLKRQQIYYIQTSWESIARENIQKSIIDK